MSGASNLAKQLPKLDLLTPRADGSGESVVVSPSLVTLSDPLGPAAEAIRALRTHIQSQHLQEGRRGLAICGVSAGHGCTFVASNLAVALSQIGVATLLIDANLREPGVDKLLPRASTLGGLRECLLKDHAPVSDFIDEDVLPNLSVLYAGAAAQNAQELLARDRFEDVMNTCMRNFDATIIDTPPANASADARRVSNVVGYSLVVARKHQSLVGDIRTLVGQLQGDRAVVVGTVLNES
jgi:capsular exopolysaccharide synthesis family protein